MMWSKSTVPYKNSDLYKIAGLFNIEQEHIPCIIFFRNVKESDVIIWPVHNSWRDDLFYDLDIFFSQLSAHSFTESKKFYGNIGADDMWSKVQTGMGGEAIWINIMTYAKDENARKHVPAEKVPYCIEYPNSIEDIFNQIYTMRG